MNTTNPSTKLSPEQVKTSGYNIFSDHNSTSQEGSVFQLVADYSPAGDQPKVINEITQSQAEYTTMAFSAAPNAIVRTLQPKYLAIYIFNKQRIAKFTGFGLFFCLDRIVRLAPLCMC